MKAWRKDYTPKQLTIKTFKHINAVVGCFNARKFGKHRRGMVTITRVEGHPENDGMRVRVHFAQRRRNLPTSNGKFPMFPFADFRRVLSKLHR